jgi:peptide/nickel transport system substrate-binding protein
MTIGRRGLIGAGTAFGLLPGLAAAQAGGILRTGLDARDVGSLDPALTKTGADEQIARQMFNSLVAPPPGTMDGSLETLRGELAERWEISPDRRTWSFWLRPGVKWHRDYGEVTAEDVKFSFERQLDRRLGGSHGSNFRDIERIETPDPLTVVIRLKESNPFFHVDALLPNFGSFIVPKRAVEELGADFARRPVGSGPFEFVSYTPQDSIVLRAFPSHFAGRPPLDEVRFRYMPDNNARTIAFIGRELESISGARDPRWVDRIRSAAPGSIVDVLMPGSLVFIYFNMSRRPFDDIRVRQAVAYALDRRLWARAFGALAGPLPGIVPEGFFGALPAEGIPAELRYVHDPDRAKRLLAEAGFPNGFQVEAIASERADYRQHMLMVQDQLRRVGIDVQLRMLDHAAYHADIRRDRGSIVLLSTGIAANAATVLGEFLSGAAVVGKPTANRNFAHYGDIGGSIDAELSAAIAAPDTARQVALLREAQVKVLRDLPVFPLMTLGLVSARQGTLDLGYRPVAGYGWYDLAKARLNRA